MIKKIKNFIIAGIVGMTLALPGAALVAPAAVFAATNATNITGPLCKGINDAAGGSGGSGCESSVDAKGSLSKIAQEVVNIFSIIIGIVAVIMILVGGFKYITSGGSQEKVGSAKNTIIYALIGLIIVALAQFIVHYVLNFSTNAVNG